MGVNGPLSICTSVFVIRSSMLWSSVCNLRLATFKFIQVSEFANNHQTFTTTWKNPQNSIQPYSWAHGFVPRCRFIQIYGRIRTVNKKDVSKLRRYATFIYDSIYNTIIFRSIRALASWLGWLIWRSVVVQHIKGNENRVINRRLPLNGWLSDCKMVISSWMCDWGDVCRAYCLHETIKWILCKHSTKNRSPFGAYISQWKIFKCRQHAAHTWIEYYHKIDVPHMCL